MRLKVLAISLLMASPAAAQSCWFNSFDNGSGGQMGSMWCSQPVPQYGGPIGAFTNGFMNGWETMDRLRHRHRPSGYYEDEVD